MFQPDEPGGIQNIIRLWIVLFWVFFFVFRCTESRAAEYHLLNLEKVNLEWERQDPSNRDPYVPEYTGQWRERAALDWRASVMDVLYWDNWIHTETVSSGQVKTVGWKWEAGLRITPWLDLFQSHHSRHVMDVGPVSGEKFPVENGTGFRIRWIPESSGRSIWK